MSGALETKDDAQGSGSLDDDIKLIDASMRLADFAAAQRVQRQSFEWRMAFGIWALLSAASLKGFAELSIFAVLIPILHANWLQNVWVRHMSDASLTWNYFNEAQRLAAKHGLNTLENPIKGASYSEKAKRKILGIPAGFLMDWAMRLELVITIGLTVTMFAVAKKITWFSLVVSSDPLLAS